MTVDQEFVKLGRAYADVRASLDLSGKGAARPQPAASGE